MQFLKGVIGTDGRCEEQGSAPTCHNTADRQEGLTYNDRYADQVITDHLQITKAAVELGDLSTISLKDYMTCAAKLDNGTVDYPEVFAVKALLFVVHHQLAARTLPQYQATDMFRLSVDGATQVPLLPFQALAPRLQSILPLSITAMETALVQGLFGSVMMHFMDVTLPGYFHEVMSVACALQDSCRAAASRCKAAHEAHMSVGQSAISNPCPSWIPDMHDAAAAVLVLLAGDITLGDMDALHRVRQARAGSLTLLSGRIEKEPWATMARRLYDLSELTIIPEIHQSLQACALHHAVWARAAANIPGWKNKMRPHSTITQQLEDMLWKVLLKDWANLNQDNAAGCCSFLERLRLARSLTAHSRPADAELDAMQGFAHTPQLIQRSLSARLPPDTCHSTPAAAHLT